MTNYEIVAFVAVVALVVVAIIKTSEILFTRRIESHLRNAEKTGPISLEDAKFGNIVVTDDHVSITAPRGQSTIILWACVTRVTAFKRDIFTVDLICMALEFERETGATCIQVHEEMVGFKTLMEALPKRFPLRDEHWWTKVAFPAFAANVTVLWEKSGSEIVATKNDGAFTLT